MLLWQVVSHRQWVQSLSWVGHLWLPHQQDFNVHWLMSTLFPMAVPSSLVAPLTWFHDVNALLLQHVRALGSLTCLLTSDFSITYRFCYFITLKASPLNTKNRWTFGSYSIQLKCNLKHRLCNDIVTSKHGHKHNCACICPHRQTLHQHRHSPNSTLICLQI